MREFLIYIAYKACHGYETWSNTNSSLFTRAKSLIASIIFFHLIHLMIFLADKSFFPLRRIEGALYFGLISAFIGIFILCELLFTKKILVRSIAAYKDHWVNNYSKLFAFGYLLFTIALTFILLYIRTA
jgi:hypothetical protein